jgi:protein-glutamine gamma-glutamyltransferase
MTPADSSQRTPAIKTPPLLLGATLLFWGWQTGFFIAGAVMAVVLESARFIRARWDLSDADFSRIWTFCTVFTLAAAVYAFSENEGPATLGGLLHGSAAAAGRFASVSSVRTANALMRWLPMTLYLFIVAQMFGSRETVSLATISFILRWRSRKRRQRGEAPEAVRAVNVSYPYFMVCLFSASFHANEGNPTFFVGLCGLVAWALWAQRSRRFSAAVWAAVFLAAAVLGNFGHQGIVRLERSVENFNAQWLENLFHRRVDPEQNVTALGQIGRLKTSGKIVIRLKTQAGSPPPVYLREASYRNFRLRSWAAGVARKDFESVQASTNGTTWVLLPGKTNAATINIACYLDGRSPDSRNPLGLLPLPTGSGRLENLNAYILQKNSLGAVLEEGPGLVIFDADYGPGVTMDSPPTNLDLVVPPEEIPALEQVISEIKPSGPEEQQTRQAVHGFFQDKFRYSLWLGPGTFTSTNETPLGRFLLHTRSGHCEYFATATVLLLRQLNIPARYAVGYAVHETAGRGYVVRERDAHAWCLVWNQQAQTWEDFDTTPPSWVAEENKRASSLQWLSDFQSWLWFQISQFRWGKTPVRQYLLWALVPVLALLLYQIIFRRSHKRRQRKQSESVDTLTSWPGLDSEFYQLEKRLAERGGARQPGETLSAWLERALTHPALAHLRVPLQELLRLHYRHRFDPRGLSGPDREKLKRQAGECLETLTKTE